MTHDRDDFLWDRSEPPDPLVGRLEEVLGPLGRRDDAPVPRRTSPAPRGRRIAGFAAAAVLLATVTLLALREDAPPQDPGDSEVAHLPPEPGAPALHVEGTGDRLVVGSWVEADAAPRELVLGDVGRIVLDAGSRVQVRRLAGEETRLYLARGRMEATVSADARPRFFQVDTDAARCVDLGCRYTLSVDPDGVAHVAVTLGQVAFETHGDGVSGGGREVYVPSGAECVARPDLGPGTPRFRDASPEVATAFDAYDTAPAGDAEARRRAALAAIALVRTERDTLPAWHLLQDRDATIAAAAAARLDEITGGCSLASLPRAVPRAEDRAAWKEFLDGRCW